MLSENREFEFSSNVIVIDTETGGLRPEHDALLSVALIDVKTKDALYIEITPPRHLTISAEALMVNGFSLDECFSKARTFEREAVKLVSDFIQQHSPMLFAGCNVAFDLAFLRAAFSRHKVPSNFSHRAFDLQSLAFIANEVGIIRLPINERTQQPSLALDSVLTSVNLTRTGNIHNALEDAQLTLDAILSISKKML